MAKKARKKAAPRKKAAKKKTGKKRAAKKSTRKKSARKPNPAFMKPLAPSATLAELVGSKARPRTEIVKKIWDYIKKNGLQDKKDKRMINADVKLKAVLRGKGKVSMFELAKALSKNLGDPPDLP